MCVCAHNVYKRQSLGCQGAPAGAPCTLDSLHSVLWRVLSARTGSSAECSVLHNRDSLFHAAAPPGNQFVPPSQREICIFCVNIRNKIVKPGCFSEM